MSSFRCLGCGFRDFVSVGLNGPRVAERLVRALLIVKLDITNYSLPKRTRVNEFGYVDAFELERDIHIWPRSH